jgi:hypothetical protein
MRALHCRARCACPISGAKHRAPTIETIVLLTFYETIKPGIILSIKNSGCKKFLEKRHGQVAEISIKSSLKDLKPQAVGNYRARSSGWRIKTG